MAKVVPFAARVSAALAAGALLVSAALFFFQKTIDNAETWATYGIYFLIAALVFNFLDYVLPQAATNALQRALFKSLIYGRRISFPYFSLTVSKTWWKIVVVITALALFATPFFWFENGQGDYGGDSSRLYFIDPLAWLKQRALFAIVTSDFGAEYPMFSMIPFLLVLQFVKVLVLHNPSALLAISNGFLLATAFASTYLLIRDVHDDESDMSSVKAAAYLGGLFFVFSPLLMFSWIKPLFRFHEIALYPLLTWLLVRFVQKRSYAMLVGGVFLTAIFALNFGFLAAPSLFAAWPFLGALVVVYALIHKRLKLFLRGLLVFLGLFFALNAFHILPQIMAFTNTSSSFYQSTFTAAGKAGRGLQYFESVRPSVRLIYNLARLPQYLLYTQTVSSQELLHLISHYALRLLPVLLLFPAIILFALIRSTSDSKPAHRSLFLATSLLFLVSLFCMTANMFGLWGPRVYGALFAIPGFAMFRSFYGVFSFIFLFLYALTVGLGLRHIFQYTKNSLVHIGIVGFLLVPAAYTAVPFIRGDIVNVVMNDTRDVRVANRFSPAFTETLAWLQRHPLDAKFLTFPLSHFDSQVIEGDQGGAYVGPSPLALLAGKSVFTSLASFNVPDSALFNQEFFLDRMRAYDIVALNRLFSLMNIDFIFYNRSPGVYQKAFTGWPYSPDIFSLFPETKEFARWTNHFGYRPIYENGSYVVFQYPDFFLPHFYTPRTIVKRENPNDFKDYLISQEGYDIRTAFYRLPNSPDELIVSLPEYIPNTPTIEFRKLSHVKYRIRVTGLQTSLPLIFSHVFHPGWKLIPVPRSPEPSQGPEYVSPPFNGTIQNDNVPDIRPWETWRRPAVAEKYHLRVNEYANSWLLDPAYLQKQFPESVATTPDGKISAEFVAEFTPQRSFIIGAAISLLTFLVICGFLGAAAARTWQKRGWAQRADSVAKTPNH